MAAARPGPDAADDPASRFDLIVVGGGINGAAVAREAALHGLRVLVLEQGDIASGTSSASSRLVHGGLRYLEHGELGLVRESLAERERLLKLAPHLVEPLALLIPVYSSNRRPLWQIRIGLTLYDWLSFDKALPDHRALDAKALLEAVPGLRAEGLRGGVRYFDARCAFPERLVLENLLDAAQHGTVVRTYTAATAIEAAADGTVAGVRWRARGGRTGGARAPRVVDPAGAGVDGVLGGAGGARLIGGTKGSHLIVEPFPGAPADGLYVEAGADGRPFFILPWNGLYLIGTTDRRYDGDPGDARIDAGELEYLCAETERVFPGAAPLRERLCYTHSGVRPLPYTPRGAEGAITRRHLIRPHERLRGLYSIVGGKLTTHRAVAEDVLRVLFRSGRVAAGQPLPLDSPPVGAAVQPRSSLPVGAAVQPRSSPRSPPRARRAGTPTRVRPFPGALDAADRDSLLTELGIAFGADEAARLWRTYGAAAGAIGALARDPAFRPRAERAGALLAAELVHALDAEWAVTLTDILQRRTMLGLRADFGLGIAPLAAEWLVRLGYWDRARAEQELAAYRAYAAEHGALRAPAAETV